MYKISKLHEKRNRKRKRKDKKGIKYTLEQLLPDNLNYLIALLNAKALLLNSKKRMK